MATKNIKIYYYYPSVKKDGKDKLADLKPILEGLNQMLPEDRVLNTGEENIQLKKLYYREKSKRWELSFLRNFPDAPFKTKLDDNTDTAEALDEDEFVGQECCAIYDESTNILSIQNNRNSISFNGVASFLSEYSNSKITLSVITYEDKYSNVLEDDHLQYRSVIIGYTDISKLIEFAQDDKENNSNNIIKELSKLSNDMSAINGKVELNVGRSKNFLNKNKLKKLVTIFKNDTDVTKNLKVKMYDGDTIKLIDLLNNKVYNNCQILITKDDPKTFKKILDQMDSAFDIAVKESFDKCKKFTNS